jgi:hypothetical protein
MVLSFVVAALALQVAPEASPKKIAQEQGERASDPANKMICKRFLETGSLVRSYRMCKTKVDWEKSRDAIRRSTSSESCRVLGQGGTC